jgi:hypothetical protein
MSLKYSKWQYNISTFSNLRTSKIYPNWDFWFENKPSGSPDTDREYAMRTGYVIVEESETSFSGAKNCSN